MNMVELTSEGRRPAIPRRNLVAALRRSDELRTFVPLAIAILAVGGYASAQSTLFLTGTNLRVLLDSVAALGLVTVGMSMLLIAGLLDLSVGAAASLAAVVGAKVLAGGSSEGVAIVTMLALTMGIAVTIAIVVVVTRVQPFILTLGLLSVLQGLALTQTGQRPVPIGNHFQGLETATALGMPVSFLMFVAALVAGGAILRYTRLGRSAYVVGANEDAAYLSGIAVGRVKVALFAFSGLLVGLAGLLLMSSLGAGDAGAGVGLELNAIAAAVIGGASLMGGRGTMLGTFLGVLLLGTIANALTLLNVSSFYQQIILGGLLIFAVTATAVAEARRDSNLPLRAAVRQTVARGLPGARRRAHIKSIEGRE